MYHDKLNVSFSWRNFAFDFIIKMFKVVIQLYSIKTHRYNTKHRLNVTTIRNCIYISISCRSVSVRESIGTYQRATLRSILLNIKAFDIRRSEKPAHDLGLYRRLKIVQRVSAHFTIIVFMYDLIVFLYSLIIYNWYHWISIISCSPLAFVHYMYVCIYHDLWKYHRF